MTTNRLPVCDNGVMREYTAQELEQVQIDTANYPLQQANYARQWRNQLLTACDWTQIPDCTVDKQAWLAYRQALRDITTQTGFPLQIQWPTQPE
jgi:hypothetical protein